jgi:hypothetical protein
MCGQGGRRCCGLQRVLISLSRPRGNDQVGWEVGAPVAKLAAAVIGRVTGELPYRVLLVGSPSTSSSAAGCAPGRRSPPGGFGVETPGRKVLERLVFRIVTRELDDGVLAMLGFDDLQRLVTVRGEREVAPIRSQLSLRSHQPSATHDQTPATGGCSAICASPPSGSSLPTAHRAGAGRAGDGGRSAPPGATTSRSCTSPIAAASTAAIRASLLSSVGDRPEAATGEVAVAARQHAPEGGQERSGRLGAGAVEVGGVVTGPCPVGVAAAPARFLTARAGPDDVGAVDAEVPVVAEQAAAQRQHAVPLPAPMHLTTPPLHGRPPTRPARRPALRSARLPSGRR